MPDEADADDREIEEQLRAMPRRVMSPARAIEMTNLLRAAERAAGSLAVHRPWWRRPVPLWRAIAASIVLASASVATALGMARNGGPEEQAPIADFAINKISAPAAIVFVEHEWPRHDQHYPGHNTLRGWRFMLVEHGETLQ